MRRFPSATPLRFLIALALFAGVGRGVGLCQSADLGIAKTVDNPTPSEDEEIVYTLVLTNSGPDVATNIEVTDTLPQGVTFARTSDPIGYDDGNGTWSVSWLDAHDSVELTITAAVDLWTAGSRITNVASITAADQADNVPGNNEDEAAVTVQSADLWLNKSVSDSFPNEGDLVDYVLELSNAGPDDATDVEVTDYLPYGVTYVTASDSNGFDSGNSIWTVPLVAANSSTTLTITVAVDALTGGQAITNTAAIHSAGQTDPQDFNNEDSAVFRVRWLDLGITKTVDRDYANVGETVAYTLRLENAGPDDATNVEVLDLLPDGVTYATSSDMNSYDSSNGIWSVRSLPVAGSTTLVINATVNEGTGGQTIHNSASISSADQADHSAGNDSDQASFSVRVADLGVSQAVTDGSTASGRDLVYTVTVVNAGPDMAGNVNVTHTLPAGVTTSDPLTKWLGDMSNGAEVAYSFRVTIGEDTVGVIGNTVAVASYVADNRQEDNTNTTVTAIVCPRHSCPGFRSAGTSAVACEFEVGDGMEVTTLRWSVGLPAGWRIKRAWGDGNPRVQGTNIVFGALPPTNLVAFSWEYSTPGGAATEADIRSTVEYAFGSGLGGTCPVFPEPLGVERLTYVTATAVGQGWISPSGTLALVFSGRVDLTLGAAPYYVVSDVVVDGFSVGKVTNYSFLGSYDDRSIEAIFAPILTSRGTPHWWLAGHSLTNGGFQAEELADPDGDGVPTWQEWVADTVPTNAQSILVVTGACARSNGVLISWQGGTAATQIVERATCVTNEPVEWTTIHTVLPPTPAGGSYRDLQPGGPSGRYYRIRVER